MLGVNLRYDCFPKNTIVKVLQVSATGAHLHVSSPVTRRRLPSPMDKSDVLPSQQQNKERHHWGAYVRDGIAQRRIPRNRAGASVTGTRSPSHSLPPSSTHVHSHSLTHTPIHSITLIQSLAHPLTQLLTRALSHSITHTRSRSFTRTHSLTHMHSFTLIHSFTHSLTLGSTFLRGILVNPEDLAEDM